MNQHYQLKNLSQSLGVSLLEMLIAILILSLGLLGLAKMQTLMISNTTLAEQQNQATNLAESKIEELRSFSTIPTTSGSVAYNDIVTSNDPANASSNTTFNRSWTVTTSANPNPPYKLITVTVSWQSTDGATQTVTLSSVIAQIDPVNVGRIMEN